MDRRALLELHRGTLTTQARVKKLTARPSTVCSRRKPSPLAALHGGDYQREELETAWRRSSSTSSTTYCQGPR